MAVEAATKSAGLAGVIEDLGYGCTQTESALEDVVKQFPSVDEPAIARVLGMMVRTHTKLDDRTVTQAALAGVLGSSQVPEGASWNIDVAIDVFRSTVPSLDPIQIIDSLDYDGFLVEDAQGFLMLTNAWKRLSPEPFPLQSVVGRLWQNSAGQLSFLRHAAVAPPDVFTFEHAPQKLAPLEVLHSGKSPVGLPNQAWLCLDLYNIVSRMAEAGHHTGVHQLLEHPVKNCPEVLCVGMAAVRTEWGVLQQEMCESLVTSFVAIHPNSTAVLSRVWPHNQDVVVRAMLALYKQEDTSISRILDVCEELKALTVVLDATPFEFAVELAALAARREYLNVEKWLQERIGYHRLPFLTAVVQFVARKIQGNQVANGQSGIGGQVGKINLLLETLAIFLRVLQVHSQGGPPEILAEVLQLERRAVALHPELQVLIIEAAAASSSPIPPASFPSDIEEEANAYFQKLYAADDGESVDSLIERLTAMKTSRSQREQDIFRCMIQSLFDEYRFFHKYPDKELQTTAALFGGLISSNLVVDQSLGDALRLFLDAVRNPAGHKMCNFGLQALRAIMDQLAAWPQYCRNLLQAANLREKDPELAETAQRIVQEFGEGPCAPPGFEQPAGFEQPSAGESLPGDAAPGVQLAEQALAEPVGPPSLVAVASGASSHPVEIPLQQPELPSSGGPESSGAAGPEQAKAEGEGKGANEERTPFGTAAAQEKGQPAHLPGSPRLPRGSMDDVPRPSVSVTQSAMDHRRAFQAVNAETLELAAQTVDYVMPPHKVQDRIGFLINNLSNSNLDHKAKELKELLTEEYWPWFCTYMVVKRAAQEQNFHVLYASLLNALQLKDLWRSLVLTTYKYVKILLASERIKTQSSERSLLKNLGSWLGRITFAQGQPVKHKDLDIKGIIIEAYEQGKMIAVLPFVNKVLEPCKDSKVFRPPNPWITGILSLMAEIYHTDKLKLNLTFEIEMLFRNFNLQISDTRLSKELTNRKRDMATGTDYTIDRSLGDGAGQQSSIPPSPARSVPGISDASPQAPGSSTRPSAAPRASLDGFEVAKGHSIQVPPQPQDQGLIGNYHNHVQINASLQPVAERLGLKRMVPVAVDRAVADIITPVVERSVTIACMTTQELILKDFSMEPDEASVRKVAHLMVSSLAGSLALVTCREPLRSSLAAQLRHLLANTMEPNQLEQTVQVITGDNFELGCTIIEKSATDKAIRDINERLAPAFQARQKAAAAGQPFYDAASALHRRFPQTLPEAMRPKPGHLSPQQQRVYEDFARIPRAPAPPPAPGALSAPGLGPGSPHKAKPSDKVSSLASGDRNAYDEASLALAHLAEAVAMWQQRLDMLVSKSPTAVYMPLPEGGDVAATVNEVLDLVPEGTDEQGVLVARKIFLHMFDVLGNSLHTTSSAAALALLRSRLSPRMTADLTATWIGLPDDRKWRKDVAEAALRARALNAPELDAHLSKVLHLNRSTAQPVEFAVHLVRQCVVAEPMATAAEFYNTLEVLQKLVVPQVPGNMAATLQQLIDQARHMNHVPAQKLNESGDPPVLRAQISQVFDEWIRLSDEYPRDEAHDSFVARLQQLGFLKGDEMTDRFFRIMTNLAVTHSLSNEAAALRSAQLSYLALDAYVHLVVLLVNVHSGGVPLLSKVLSVLAACLQRDAEMRSADFNGRPYYRIFLGLIQELSPGEKLVGARAFGSLGAIATALSSVQPLQVPGFAFSWLELISHRKLMPKLVNDQQGWSAFHRLLIALLRFLEPYLRNAELTDSVRLLYKGTLRVLLVLLHDFPEFLCEYHFEICNVVPPSCIQMRNLILSAFPRNMRLPDPFTPNLKVDLLPEIGIPPRFLPSADNLLPAPMRAEVDTYLAQRQPLSFLTSLCPRLMLPSQDMALSGTRYNVSLLNAVVFYVGIKAVTSQQQNQPGSSPVMHSPAMDVFQRMAGDMDTEGRYLFLNALANQLRYPNNHTHYFSCVLLYLFAEAKQEIVQEQITRVLLERLIVNRPHPWGLLITFIELIKNPRYSFWSYSFTRCAGEIERLFESVARSCMGTGIKPDEEGQSVG